MSKKVWTTTVNRPGNVRMFGVSFPTKFDYLAYYPLSQNQARTEQEQAEWHRLVKENLAINKPYNAGKKMDSQIVPTTLYGHSVSPNIDFPSFCRTPYGHILLNEACANLLKQFRLGETAIYPVSFFDVDRQQPVNDQTYYFLNIAEWLHYLLPEFSTKDLNASVDFSSNPIKNEEYQLHRLYHVRSEDNAIALSTKASQCDLDLWHDPALTNSIFISDELKQALDDAGMGQEWLFYECQLVMKQSFLC